MEKHPLLDPAVFQTVAEKYSRAPRLCVLSSLYNRHTLRLFDVDLSAMPLLRSTYPFEQQAPYPFPTSFRVLHDHLCVSYRQHDQVQGILQIKPLHGQQEWTFQAPPYTAADFQWKQPPALVGMIQDCGFLFTHLHSKGLLSLHDLCTWKDGTGETARFQQCVARPNFHLAISPFSLYRRTCIHANASIYCFDVEPPGRFTFWRFDPGGQTSWRPTETRNTTSLLSQIFSVSVMAGDCFYLVGGGVTGRARASSHRLDLRTNRWDSLPSCHVPRACHACVVLPSTRDVLVVGGRRAAGTGAHIEEEIYPEYFESRMNRWRVLPYPLPTGFETDACIL